MEEEGVMVTCGKLTLGPATETLATENPATESPATETPVCPPQSLPGHPGEPGDPPEPRLPGDPAVLAVRLLHLPGPPGDLPIPLPGHLRSGLGTRGGLAGHCQTAGSLLSPPQSPYRNINTGILKCLARKL